MLFFVSDTSCIHAFICISYIFFSMFRNERNYTLLPTKGITLHDKFLTLPFGKVNSKSYILTEVS